MEIEEAAREIAALGVPHVVIKGGHGGRDDSADLLYLAHEQRCLWLEAPRISTKNTHGTGCTFSAAITAALARGQSVEQAVCSAKRFLTDALERGHSFRLGNGHGPALLAPLTSEPE